MRGKTCLLTGATSGIGKVAAVALARLGATVILVGRDPARGEAALREIKEKSGNERVELALRDLGAQREVRALAEDIKRRHGALHVLVNNAGVALRRRTLTEDGLEATFAVNHLGPFLLTNLLLDTLRASAPARVVNVSSSAHHVFPIDWEDLQSERRYFIFRAYAVSKLANILFTYELARRLSRDGVTVNCLHPGVIPDTRLDREMPGIFSAAVALGARALAFGASPEEGAETIIFLASSPEVEGVTGKYFIRRKPARSSRLSYDRAAATRLWQASEALVRAV